MNERNVEALANIMDQPEFLAKWSFGMTSREIAEHFASKGVLVPSALTEDGMESVLRDFEDADLYEWADTKGFAVRNDKGQLDPLLTLVARLERIARGEA